MPVSVSGSRLGEQPLIIIIIIIIEGLSLLLLLLSNTVFRFLVLVAVLYQDRT